MFVTHIEINLSDIFMILKQKKLQKTEDLKMIRVLI